MLSIYDANGRRMSLGKEVGRGGEGTVYEVIGNPGRLAKIYTKTVSAEKAEKLAAMARVANPELLKIAAWPITTLHDTPSGRLQGFLMPRIMGHHEVHAFYNPAHRKQAFPEANWSFLIHIARNVAAAIAEVHAQGHVIGDINQKGLLVLPGQGTVQLIDCDSFQIHANGRHFLCEVGVQDFTPPELQGKSFQRIVRTPNQDNFGLAVICFLLLFMGRHPFAGRYRGPGEDSLEQAIRECRFAYSPSASTKQMTPPPHALQLVSVSPQIADLFERAFGEAAARQGNRPSARAWVTALETLKGELRACAQAPIHKYHRSLTACPWCEIERAAAVYFFIAITTTTAGAVSFDLEAIWAQIRAVRSPGPAVLPDVTPTAPITPAPLPPKVRAGRIWKAARIVGTFVVGGLMLAAFPQWGALIVIVSIGCLVWAVASKVHDGGEGERRRQALRQAQMHWETIERRWQQEAGEDRFIRKFQEWEQKHAEYRALPASYQRDLQQLHANRRAIQLHRFLAQHFIYQAKIDGIGPSLKTILVSYNIETAADLTSQAVRAVPGFGPARTKELLKWRAGIESIFRFDPRAGVDPKDSAALDQAYDKKRRDLQTGLLRGPHELEQERSRILRQRADMMTELRQAAIPLAQAIADVTLL